MRINPVSTNKHRTIIIIYFIYILYFFINHSVIYIFDIKRLLRCLMIDSRLFSIHRAYRR